MMLYQTHARIHLGNIRRNLENIRAFIGPDCKLLLALKANGYGHGAAAIAAMAQGAGLADWLGVATLPEALELRHAGLQLPILKFSPAFEEEMAAALDGGITLTVCELANIKALQLVCRAKGARARVHLKLDTGMGRIGAEATEAAELALFIEKHCPDLHLEGVFTHLSVGDVAAGAAYTKEQLALFRKTADGIIDALGRRPELFHCASSGAILEHQDSWFSMVRAGSIAYGYYPNRSSPKNVALYPGMSFLTRIAFLKKVKKGTSLGYGRTWVAPEDTWIATIPAGFADGFSRLLSNCGRVLISGQSYPIVGRVCMDQAMIDLGPETGARVGDEVVLIGRSGDQEITTYELAEIQKTVPCDITCQINARVARVFDHPDH